MAPAEFHAWAQEWKTGIPSTVLKETKELLADGWPESIAKLRTAPPGTEGRNAADHMYALLTPTAPLVGIQYFGTEEITQ
jgi:hypothetical protein